MQVVGFNLRRISASREETFKKGPMNLNIEFTDVQKEKLDLLKEEEAIKILFKFGVEYYESDEKKDPKKDKLAEISMDGQIRMALSKEELKDVLKAWKKKQMPPGVSIPLNNMILKRTAAKALQLQDDLGLPSHIPIQQLRPQQNPQ